jgi:AmiR/NasT family two-component response regulator
VINQAAGILIAQRHCSADKAFHLLAAAAQRNRLPVEEVAADLVERTSAGGPPGRGGVDGIAPPT